MADRAGVATETLYSHFASKRALLQAVMDVAAVGDEQPVAVAEATSSPPSAPVRALSASLRRPPWCA